MAKVIIEGSFLGSSVRVTKDDKKKLDIDIYQAGESRPNARVSTDDLEYIGHLKDYTMGSPIRVTADANGFNNNVYFNLIEILPDKK